MKKASRKPNTIGTPQGVLSRHCWLTFFCMNLTKSLKAKGFGRSAMRMTLFSLQKAEKRPKGCLNGSLDFIEQKLFLKVNAERRRILRIGDPEVQFLGFSFTSQVSKKRRERYPTYGTFPVVHRKKMLKLKEKLKQITDRRAPGGIERVKRELKLTLRGWVNYFTRAIPDKWVEQN